MANLDDTIVLAAGSVQYDIEEAKCSIDDLIASLEQARANGAEYVVMDSGNHYRGAKWQTVVDEWDWAADL